MGDPPEEEETVLSPIPTAHPLYHVTKRKKETKEREREKKKNVRTVPSVEFSSVSFLFDGREQKDRGTPSPPPPSRAIIISPG